MPGVEAALKPKTNNFSSAKVKIVIICQFQPNVTETRSDRHLENVYPLSRPSRPCLSINRRLSQFVLFFLFIRRAFNYSKYESSPPSFVWGD